MKHERTNTRFRCKNFYVGPDVIAEVDGVELGAFYMDSADAHAAVNRHIDAQEKAKKNGI